ncbi:MAG TPA: sulfatase-like hydrolase/transferase [Polyangia bacterium]|nr:sulfatase-like hydrolase/transferase [Polyangia bacterium]
MRYIADVPEAPPQLGRTLRGALVLGMLGGLLLGVIEGALSWALAPLAVDSLGEHVRVVELAAVLGSLAGALVGAVVALAQALAKTLSSRLEGSRRPHAEARVYTLLLAPITILACRALFSGRRAQTLPAAPLLPYLVALVLLLLAYAGLRLLLWQRTRWAAPSEQGPSPMIGTARATAALLLVVILVLCLADHLVLPRLYLPLHLGMEGLGLGLSLLAAGALVRGSRRLRSMASHDRWLAPRRVAWLGLVLLAANGWALRNLIRQQTLRAAIFEHTGLPSRLLAMAHAAGLTPAARPAWATATAKTEAVVTEDRALAPLPDGPHLPGADVFLITVDALRADRLTPGTTPYLARLAEDAVRFDHAYTQVPHTSFALATLLTGKYVFSLAQLGEDPARHETLAEVFQRDRYKTAAFFPPSIFFIDHDKFVEVEKQAYRFEYVKYEYMGAAGRTDQVIRFLEGERPERVFLWVHYFEPHEPYDLHPGVTINGRVPVTALERYDGEVRYVDGEIGRLVEYLRRSRPRAVLAITADHGEEFGEHGGRYHGTTLYEEQVHVPLFITTLGGAPGLGARRIGKPVGLIDLGPTLLGLADILPSARMRGVDLGPWLAMPRPAAEDRLPPVFAEIGSKKLVALGGDRLLCDVALDFCELYDVGSDTEERHNLAGAQPERVQAARRHLDAWLTEQSARERPGPVGPHGAGDLAQARRALERGRQGDRSVVPEVMRLLGSDDATVRAEAALVLLRLPDDPETGPAIRAAVLAARGQQGGDALTAARLDVIALRLGERALADAVAQRAAAATEEAELRAYAALALAAVGDARAVPLAARSLTEGNEETLEKALIAALGKARDRRAVAPLIAHLEKVRTRVDTVRALGELGGPVVVAALRRALPGETYVSVRAEMVRQLGRLGDPGALPALLGLWTRETEAQVVAELGVAIVRLGGVARVGGSDLRQEARRRAGMWSCRPEGCLPRQPDLPAALPLRARRGVRELWLVTDGTPGVIEVGGVALRIESGVRAHMVAPVPAQMAVRVREGSPHVVAALPR